MLTEIKTSHKEEIDSVIMIYSKTTALSEDM